VDLPISVIESAFAFSCQNDLAFRVGGGVMLLLAKMRDVALTDRFTLPAPNHQTRLARVWRAQRETI